MLKVRHIAIRAAIIASGLALAASGQAAETTTQRRCMDHFTAEWRHWALEQDQRDAEARATRIRDADNRAAAWDELATSPGISAHLALTYRKKANVWRAGAVEDAAKPHVRRFNGERLTRFCDELVTALIRPNEAKPHRRAATKPRLRRQVSRQAAPNVPVLLGARTRGHSSNHRRPFGQIGIGIGIGF